MSKGYYDPIRKGYFDEAGSKIEEQTNEPDPERVSRTKANLMDLGAGPDTSGGDPAKSEDMVESAGGRPLRRVLICNPGEMPIEALYDESTKVITPIML